MPRKGRKTIDYPEAAVNRWQSIYNENEDIINLKGYSNFSSFMTFILDQLYEKGSVPDWVRKLLSP